MQQRCMHRHVKLKILPCTSAGIDHSGIFCGSKWSSSDEEHMPRSKQLSRCCSQATQKAASIASYSLPPHGDPRLRTCHQPKCLLRWRQASAPPRPPPHRNGKETTTITTTARNNNHNHQHEQTVTQWSCVVDGSSVGCCRFVAGLVVVGFACV